MIAQFWLIFPLVLGIIALNKMKTHKPSTGFCVCILIFCNVLGGIFLLCSKESDYGTPAPVVVEEKTEE